MYDSNFPNAHYFGIIILSIRRQEMQVGTTMRMYVGSPLLEQFPKFSGQKVKRSLFGRQSFCSKYLSHTYFAYIYVCNIHIYMYINHIYDIL